VLIYSAEHRGYRFLEIPPPEQSDLKKKRDIPLPDFRSFEIAVDCRGVLVELIFERERPESRTEGNVIGIDRGFRKAFVTSDGQEIGVEARDQIRRKDKRSKTARRHIKTELLWYLKGLRLEDAKAIVLEEPRYIKHGWFERQGAD
jgi:transposase